MKKNFQVVIISMSVLIFSCNSKTDIGLGILPENDILDLYITDTSSIEVYTLTMDSIASNNVNRFLLGEYNDPIFGYSKASFVTQYSLVESPTMNSTYILDSAVLTLALDTVYSTHYGNTASMQNITVYRLNTALYDTTYYGNHNPADYMTGDIIGQAAIIPDQTGRTISIPLSQTFGEEFLTLKDTSTNPGLRAIFKGVYIKSDVLGGDGAIMKIDIRAESVITIYAHDIYMEQSTFKITSNSTANIRFNLFEHDYSTTSFYTQLNDENSVQDSVAYIQSMGGLRTKIKFPFIEKFKEMGDIAIYRAELVIKTSPSDLTQESEYPAIEKMKITGYNSEYEYSLFPEYMSSTTYSGVSLDEGTYKFDIAGYILDILSGDIENNGFFLFTYSGSTVYNRSVITTGKHSDRMKLYISYAKL